jgi:hypothetical protein
MTTPSKNDAAFKAVKAELISMVPLAFQSMAKSYITEEHVTRILKAALSATQAAQESLRGHEESKRRRRDGWLVDLPGIFVESGRKALNEAEAT